MMIKVRAMASVTVLVTVALAFMHTFGSPVLSKPTAQAAVFAGLVAAVYLGTSRDFYMPFLGVNVIPPSVLKLGTPAGAEVSVTVDAPSGAMYAVYWASNPMVGPAENPATAYAGYGNSGVVEVAGGRATLRLSCPSAYKVGFGKVVPKHVHYRFVMPTGIITSVKTKEVKCP